MRRLSIPAAVIASLLFAGPSHAGKPLPHVITYTDGSGGVVRQVLPPGQGLLFAGTNGLVLASGPFDPDSARVLIEFDVAPRAIARRSPNATPESPAQRLQLLQTDLAAIAPGAVVRRAYEEVFSGAALTVPTSALPALAALPYVRGVFADDSVRKSLSESVPRIRADRVRLELGGTGAGIRVGIVDSGIDYAHPAFGGGFGPGHRVAGGWDFVNDDGDPMDDDGHGTHVAGIVAGNGGGVTGVAPEATLYAYKVLDATGVGTVSGVLAALERVLDPDGDPATDDALEVLNLSIQSGGDEDEPLSVALDHLTEAGVVCAVAAGNSGPSTIRSPGTSRRAITVGSVSKGDAFSAFSSVGPTPQFNLKPDLVAPGEGIVSAALGGGVVAMSGTSMATPHVAGVAAVLRQLHPTWTPSVVQAAIVGTAVDLGLSHFKQGAGRLDAFAAATASVVVTPTRLSYGRIATTGVWTRSDTLTLTNLTNAARTVTIPPITITAGATLEATPDSLELPAGGTAAVLVVARVDNDSLPFPLTPPYAYESTLRVHSGNETRALPVALHKSASVSVSTSEPFQLAFLHDRARGGIVERIRDRGGRAFVRPGRYDLMAVYGPPRWSFVVRPDVEVREDEAIDVSPEDATTLLEFADVDAQGRPIDCDENALSFFHEATGLSINFMGVDVDAVHVTPGAASGYRLDWTRDATESLERRVTIAGTTTDFAASRVVPNRPEDFRHVVWHAPASPVGSVAPLFYTFHPLRTTNAYLGFARLDTTAAPHAGPFTLDWWTTPSPYDGHFAMGAGLELHEWHGQGMPPLDPVFESPVLRMDRGWPAPAYADRLFDVPWFYFSGVDLRLGSTLPVWRARFLNDAHFIVPITAGLRGGMPIVTDMYGTIAVRPDPSYTLLHDDEVVDTGILHGAGAIGGIQPLSASAASYVLRTQQDFDAGGTPGRLDVEVAFDTEAPYANAPALFRFQIEADGALDGSGDWENASEVGVRYRVFETQAPPVLSWRPASESAWRPLDAEPQANDLFARLPELPVGPIDLRLDGLGLTGHPFSMTWQPAFVARSTPRPSGVEWALGGPRPNPVVGNILTVEFSLPDAAPARLALYDVAGREVLARGLDGFGAGRHAVRLTPLPRSAGVYFLRLTRGGQSLTRRVVLLR